jgi:hypothetical protein
MGADFSGNFASADSKLVPSSETFDGIDCLRESPRFASRLKVPKGDCRPDRGVGLSCRVEAEELVILAVWEAFFVDRAGFFMPPLTFVEGVVSAIDTSPPTFTISFTFPTDALNLL